MSIFKVQSQSELNEELAKVDNSSKGVAVAVEQAQEMVAHMTGDLNMSEKDAKLTILGGIEKAAQEDGANLNDVYASYPAALKEYIQYSPDDLKRNQTISAVGSALSIASWVLALFSLGGVVLRGAPILAKAVPAIYKAIKVGKTAQTASNLVSVTQLELLRKVGFLGALFGIASAGGFLFNTIVNNWNDVFHWGPTFAEQQAEAIRKLEQSQGGGGDKFVAKSYTSARTQTTAKPKLFTGTFFSGKLAKGEQFVRKVDDQITSIADMVDDLEINLVEWVKRLPGMLNYDLAVVNNPKDENGLPKQGTWVVCNLYLTNSVHKRALVENILLGPVDPAVYYPEYNSLQSINISVPEILAPAQIKALELPSGHEYVVDQQGNVVAGFFGGWDTKRDGSPLPSGAEAAKPPASAPAVPLEVSEPLRGDEKPGDDVRANPINVSQIVPQEKGAVELEVIVPALKVRGTTNTGSEMPGNPRIYKGERYTSTYAERGQNVDGQDLWYRIEYGGQPRYIWGGGVRVVGDANPLVLPVKEAPKAPAGTLASAVENLLTPKPSPFGDLFKPQPSPLANIPAPAPLNIFKPEPAPAPAPAPSTFPKNVSVIVDTLNVRESPTSSAPLAGSQKLARGDTFQVVALVDGESVNGNNKWWLSARGNYVWSGGTTS